MDETEIELKHPRLAEKKKNQNIEHESNHAAEESSTSTVTMTVTAPPFSLPSSPPATSSPPSVENDRPLSAVEGERPLEDERHAVINAS